MRRWRHRARGIWLAGWAGVWMGLLATPAAAQTTTYRCVTADGKRFTSSTPCSQARRPQTPIYYGPSQPPPVRALPPARLERAPEELTYMSPECATMREGIRTAPARGVDSRTQSELRRNFQELCTEDQSRARRALMEDKRLEQRERHQERQQVMAQDAGQSGPRQADGAMRRNAWRHSSAPGAHWHERGRTARPAAV